VGVPGWLRYTAASKKRAAVKVDEYFCKLSAESTKPFCSLRMPEVPNDLAVRSIALSKDFSSIHRRYVFNYNRVQALDRMLSVQLALRVYHLRNRSYPEKLSLKLSPHLMKTDLIDPFTGRTFRYHIKGDSFVLYSVGPDGKDDKGKPMPTGKKLQEKGDLICYGM
jgi:hypothetical protein